MRLNTRTKLPNRTYQTYINRFATGCYNRLLAVIGTKERVFAFDGNPCKWLKNKHDTQDFRTCDRWNARKGSVNNGSRVRALWYVDLKNHLQSMRVVKGIGGTSRNCCPTLSQIPGIHKRDTSYLRRPITYLAWVRVSVCQFDKRRSANEAFPSPVPPAVLRRQIKRESWKQPAIRIALPSWQQTDRFRGNSSGYREIWLLSYEEVEWNERTSEKERKKGKRKREGETRRGRQ